jgi:hypothetical protein
VRRATLVLAGLWLCGLLAALGVYLWFGLLGPAMVLAAIVSAAILMFGVDTDEPEPKRSRTDRRVPGL